MLITSSKYDYSKGYFGENSKHGKDRTRNITAPDNLAAAKDFYDKIAYLSKSMGHVTLESTKYYYSIVPNLSSIMMNQTNETFDWIVPEVNTDEEIY